MNQEKVSSVTSFDNLHNILSTTNYSYDASGALISTATIDPAGVAVSESSYSGLSGEERVTSVISYDKLNDVLIVASYNYDASGAIVSTITTDAAGIVLSKSLYYGLSGSEKISSVIRPDQEYERLYIL